MAFSVWMLVLAVFLSGAVAGVFAMLVIGIRIGDRDHLLTDEPGTPLDASHPQRAGRWRAHRTVPQEIAAPKENDQCTLLIAGTHPLPVILDNSPSPPRCVMGREARPRRLPFCSRYLIRPGPLMADVPDTGNAHRRSAPMPCIRPDRSGMWLRNAATGLCLLAVAAAVVSFTAQYRMIYATRRLALVAGLEAAHPRWRRPGLRLPRHRAGLARPPRDPGPGAEPRRSRDQCVHERDRGRAGLAEPGHLGHAPGRLCPGQRHPHRASSAPWPSPDARHLSTAFASDTATPLAIIGALIMWLLRLALAPASTLAGFRAWVLEECPVAPGRRAPAVSPASPPRPGASPRLAKAAARDEDSPVPPAGHRTARPSRLHPP